MIPIRRLAEPSVVASARRPYQEMICALGATIPIQNWQLHQARINCNGTYARESSDDPEILVT